MILILDPQPPRIGWCEVLVDSPGAPVIKRTGFSTPNEVFQETNVPDEVACVLQHGNEEFDKPVVRVTPEVLAALQRVLPLYPDANAMTLRLLRESLTRHPGVPHWVICDTAFSAELPEPAACYAVPPSLRRTETRRYGRSGIGHAHAWKLAQEQTRGAIHKVVTIGLAPQTTIAAFEDGRTMEVSSGFTMAEGMISLTSCGDIDPTLPIHLCASGMPVTEVNRVLAEVGGLNAIAGRDLKFKDVFEPTQDQKLRLAQEIYSYQLVKYIGSFAAVLGGLDAVVFFGAAVPTAEPFIHNVAEQISRVLPKAKVFRFGFNRWEALAHLSQPAFQGEFV